MARLRTRSLAAAAAATAHGPHPGFETDFCEIIRPLIGS
jgi:hypothetical protein